MHGLERTSPVVYRSNDNIVPALHCKAQENKLPSPKPPFLCVCGNAVWQSRAAASLLAPVLFCVEVFNLWQKCVCRVFVARML